MIRRCAVSGCFNTDSLTLGHRFPENTQAALKWKESLELSEFPIELLQSKFIVCNEHFSQEDYDEQSWSLQSNAVPRINCVAGRLCTEESYMRQFQAQKKQEKQQPLIPSCFSAGSVSTDAHSHDDICILDTHESHYSMSAEENEDSYSQLNCVMMESFDTPDFIVLQADGKEHKQMLDSSAFDESTEILCEKSTEQSESDVEVLHVEDSADAATETELSYTQSLSERLPYDKDSGDSMSTNTASSKNEQLALCHFEALNMGHAAEDEEQMFKYKHLSRLDLIAIIKEQQRKLKLMESTLVQYRAAHEKFSRSVDELSEELAANEKKLQQIFGQKKSEANEAV